MKLLIVEDTSMVRRVLRDTFARAGYIVIEAEDAEQAIRIFRANSDIRCVLSDVQMPGMYGDRLHAVLAEELHARGARFVAHSGGCEPEIVRYFKENGVPFFLKGKVPTTIFSLTSAA